MMGKETKVVNRSWRAAKNWEQGEVTGDWVAMSGQGSSVKPGSHEHTAHPTKGGGLTLLTLRLVSGNTLSIQGQK